MNASSTLPARIRVMIVEDHPDYREVIEMALNKEADVESVCTFGTAEFAQRYLRDAPGDKKPHVILLDLNLPGMNGLDSLASLIAGADQAKVIILTQSDQQNDVIRAISLGASGYLLKSATIGKIIEGIRVVARGDATLDAGVARYILDTLKTVLPDNAGGKHLTPRELEVLHLVADGLTKKEIAATLTLSTSTVSTHVVHIFEKLGVKNAPAAIARAFRLGLFNE